MEKGSALIHAPFSFAMIQSHHRILSLDSSHCGIWFIELFSSLLASKREGIKNSAEFFYEHRRSL